MKSKFLLTETLEKEEIIKIKDLQETKEILFEVIKEWFLEQKEYPRIGKDLTEKFALKTDSIAEDVFKAFGSIYWVNKKLVDYIEDPIPDLIEDLKSIYPDSIVDEKILLNRLNDIKEIAKKYKILIKSQRAKINGAPTLRGSSTSVIIKPVIEKRFDFDTQDIKDYKPEILKKEACVLIELEDSNKKSLTFQMDADNFERFLNDLIALQIELNSVK